MITPAASIVAVPPQSHLRAAERRLAAVENKVLGALSTDKRCTLHALLIRAAGGQLPATACTDPDTRYHKP